MPPKAKAKAAAANAAPPTKDLFVLTMKDQVVFPSIRSTVVLTADVFAKLTDYCEKHNTNVIGCVTQRPAGESPDNDDHYKIGTYGKLMSQRQETRKAGGKEETVTRISIEGKGRFEVTEFTQKEPYRLANIKLLADTDLADAAEMKPLRETVQQSIMKLVQESQNSPQGGQQNPLTNFLGGGGKQQQIKWPASASLLADMVGAGVGRLSTPERQQVLEELDVKKRLELVNDLLARMNEAVKVTKEINTNMQKRGEAEMRQAIIQRQIGELQKELRKSKGQKEPEDPAERDPEWDDADEDEEDDVQIVKDMLKKANLPKEAKEIAIREVKRLQNIQPQHPEYNVCRTYLDLLGGLPWEVSTDDADDLKRARQILDKDHYGLEKVKKRILEFLAVRKLRTDMKGPILCLHGPPGVGKTSLGKSVARSLGRKFHRIALGGVRDEAELRGHRRTYIGSMPGVVIEALRSTGVNNPVILLDEIDKLVSNSNQGNPSGALLEILDPEQNHTFKDHYVNTPFNLSRVLFLATCNELTIDRALMDRMEMIDISGYTVEEKLSIATTYLVPKQRRMHALEKPDDELTIDPTRAEELEKVKKQEEDDKKKKEAAASGEAKPEEEASKEPEGPEEPLFELSQEALKDVVMKWTTESGVRSLERNIAQLCRFAALRIANKASGADNNVGAQTQEITGTQKEAEAALEECGPIDTKTASGQTLGKVFIESKHLPYILGMEIVEPDIAERLSVGVAMGLAVSGVGGSLLFIEAAKVRGSGQMIITGNLRDVMRESVRTGMSLLRSKVYKAVAADGGPEAVEDVKTAGDSGGAPNGVSVSPLLSLSGEVSPLDALVGRQRTMKSAKDLFRTVDVHVHFPAGGIPKDGPSAGVATVLALASLFLEKPVRSDTAVTGEISLRGHVLPVGGIKDKVLAAHRAGLKHVLIPDANRKNVKEDLTEAILKDIEVHYCKSVDEALDWAFAEPGAAANPILEAPSDAGGTARAASVVKPPKAAL